MEIRESPVDSRWAAKYPFDPQSKIYLKSVALDINEYFSEDLKHIVEYSYERALTIKRGISTIWDNDDIEAISFFLAVLIVRGTDNRYVYYMFTNTESKRAYQLLLLDTPNNIVKLSKHMKIPLRYGKKYYIIPFLTYIKLTYRFSGATWRPYYQIVKDGEVYLTQRRIARILSEASKELILDHIENITMVPDQVKTYSNNLLREISDIISKQEKSIKLYEEIATKAIKYYPPCVKWMLDNIPLGLPHAARFSLVTFLGKMGFSVDEIVNIFSRAPDFNLERSKYQVEHILGLRGGRKVYSVPACRTIKSYNLCFPDKICYKVKHPLQYIARARKIEVG